MKVSDDQIEELLREIRDGLPRPQGRYGGSRLRSARRSNSLPTALGGVLVGVALAMAVLAPADDAEVGTGAVAADTATGDGAVAAGAEGAAKAADASATTKATAPGAAVAGATPATTTAVAAGPTAPGAAGAAGAATGAGTASGACTGGATARGVTAKLVKIGVVVPNEEFQNLVGDLDGAYAAQLDRWKRTKQVPVCGRDVEFVFHQYGGVGAQEAPQRAACVEMAKDKGVFAVMGWGIPIAGECLAREFKVPTIGSVYPVDEETIRRGWPYLFYTNMAAGRVLRNLPHWAHDSGFLAGKKIGLFYRDDPRVKALIDRYFRPNLTQLGYRITAEAVQGSDRSSTAIAVQRLQTSGVDTIFLMTAPAEFSQVAEAQAYRPHYLVGEYEDTSYTADGVVAGFLPQQWHGAHAMTYYRRAEQGKPGQEPIPAAGKECVDDYARFTGRRAPDKQETAGSIQWDAMQHACDQTRAVIKALQAAGANLTPDTFVRGLESVRAQPSGELADISFSATKHDGPDLFKTLEFDQGCICWKHQRPFRSAWVP